MTARVMLEALLDLAGLALLVPATVLLTETLAALLPAVERPRARTARRPRVTVMIPAHDEANQIEATVRALAADPAGQPSILVVADNCRDATADLAREAGAAVIERHDAAHVGKGFAISFGLKHLQADPPDVVAIVDADCRVSAGGISTLAELAMSTRRPVQAEYLFIAPPDAGALARVSALAILMRNQVRPRGLGRLGLPCHLTGSGMAFPWDVLRAAPDAGAHLVEDLVIGIELSLLGHPPLSCPDVQITSDLPHGGKASLAQRRRWEHGQLQALTTYGPRLVGAGIARRRPALVGLGLDLMVPPLALLISVQGAALAVALAAGVLGLVSPRPAIVSGAGLMAIGAAVAAGWHGFGRKTLSLRHLFFVPIYLLWKVPVYLMLAVRGRQKQWQRTARPSEERAPDE
jgi:hypothetical protein